MILNHGDITKINGTKVEPVDCIIGGSPCFPKDTLILTETGYKPIQDIAVGEKVQTHKNRLRTVVSVGSKFGCLVKLMGNLSDFFCTRDHPIYTHDVSLLWQYNNKSYKRSVISDEKWIAAENMLGRYWETPNIFACETESPVPLTQELCYFFGRWLGDGWCRVGKRSDRKNGNFAEVCLCDSLDKELELIKTISCVTKKFSIERQKSCVRIKFHNRNLCNILEKYFGHGTYNKTIPAFLLGSSSECRESLLKGLTDSDGHIVNDHKITYTSVSKRLILSIRILAESLGFSTSIFFNECPGCSVIDDREIKRTPIWSCSIVRSKKVGRLTYENHSLYKVRTVDFCKEQNVTVYNLEVDEDNSYVADSIVVHNCQNLSISGNKQGLNGNESRLFLEQMRVVEEMRVSSNGTKPRYMVWENVTFALSCNNGKDFQRVLMECVNAAVRTSFYLGKTTKGQAKNCQTKTNEKLQSIPDVPMPKNGKWPKSGILYDDMGRWSIAWRVHDAQYWGVAQRRRRIALVCDFGGMSAPEVLFESKSVSGDFDTCNSKGEGAAETSTGSIEESDRIWDARGNGNGRISATLTGDHDNRITDYTNVVVQKEEPDAHETATKEAVFVKQSSDDVAPSFPTEERNPEQSYPCICIGNGQAHVTEHYTEEVSQTLNCMHDPMTIFEPCAYQLVGVNSNSMKSSNPTSGCYETEQAGTITTNGCVPNNQGGTAIMEPVIPLEGNGCRESHKGDGWSTEQVSYTLNTVERHAVAYGETESSVESHPIVVDRATFNQGKNAQFDIKIEYTETIPSMVARGPHAVAQPVQYRVRRLTPLECTRLQGFPDGWVDIGDWIDSKGKKHKEADAPKYKALGNSIALPFWKWLCKNIVNQLKIDGQTTTMASLFDGIGGFPLCWIMATRSKDSVLWISEIEEFPLAVTRYNFGTVVDKLFFEAN